jgi:hypothetical protein
MASFLRYIVAIWAAALPISLGAHAAGTAPQEGWHPATGKVTGGNGSYVTVPQRDGSGWSFYRMVIFSKRPPIFYIIRLDPNGKYLSFGQVVAPPATPTSAGGSIDPYAQFR